MTALGWVGGGAPLRAAMKPSKTTPTTTNNAEPKIRRLSVLRFFLALKDKLLLK
jgi:hypothetical protein